MSQLPHQPSPTTPPHNHSNNAPSDTATAPSDYSSSDHAPSSRPSPAQSLDTLRRKASELATTRSGRRDERRQTALELAAAMPQCLNCRNKAKLNCTNNRCHACCINTHIPCLAHRTDATHTTTKQSTDTAQLSEAEREVMLDALSADDVIGLAVVGVVEGVVAGGYRVRVVVNGWVCEGVLFDDMYAITINPLPHNLTTKQLQHITLATLPPLQQPTTPHTLLPSLTPAAAIQSKPKVRHRVGYPKGPRSGYVYYSAAMRARLQSVVSEEERSALNVEWSVLSERERVPYMRLAELDKQRWMREMAEWKRMTEGGG